MIEAETRDLLERLPDPAFLLALDGRILAANGRAARLLGQPALTGQPLHAFLDMPRERFRDLLRSWASNGQPVPGRLRLRGPHASAPEVRCNGARLADRPDRPARLLLLCQPQQLRSNQFVLLNQQLAALNREIREHRRAEQRIREVNAQLEARIAERTAELTRAYEELESYSYSIAHDLRTPLRAIISFSQIVQAEAGQLEAEHRGHLERVIRAGMHMTDLINDILELSRISRLDLEPADCDLSALARRILARLAEAEPDRTVDARVADGLRARGDPRLLEQLLDNLLRNAWKYTAPRQRARIELAAVPAPDPTFVVRDNGVGFDMAYADKLFKPFQRLHGPEFEGTGVGLATVQRIVARHGGEVWAEAREDEGAAFFFRLPAGEPAAAPPAGRAE